MTADASSVYGRSEWRRRISFRGGGQTYIGTVQMSCGNIELLRNPTLVLSFAHTPATLSAAASQAPHSPNPTSNKSTSARCETLRWCAAMWLVDCPPPLDSSHVRTQIQPGSLGRRGLWLCTCTCIVELRLANPPPISIPLLPPSDVTSQGPTRDQLHGQAAPLALMMIYTCIRISLMIYTCVLVPS